MNKMKFSGAILGLALLGSAAWAALPDFNPMTGQGLQVLSSVRDAAQGLVGAQKQSAAALLSAPTPDSTPTVDKIFTGSSSWSDGDFGDLQRLGVQKDAENDAVLRCRSAGKLNCVVAGSQITSCSSGDKCQATATAIAIDVPSGAAPKTFKGSSSYGDGDYDSGYNSLERLGVQKDAENRAVQQCRDAGMLNCFATGSSISSCNDYCCKADGTAIGF